MVEAAYMEARRRDELDREYEAVLTVAKYA
jgi:hypothetical protein